MEIIQKKTPNFTAGRVAAKPEIVVIHIMDGTLTGTDSWFASPESGVSAHYSVGKKGEVHQYVKETDTAWHAGRVKNPSFSLYKKDVNPNLYTIGIEHEGNATTVWSPAMKKASAELLKDICARWNIPLDRDHVIGHYQVFSAKPDCPAKDKAIIDELILLAKGTSAPSLQDGIKKVEEGLAIIKSAIH